MIRKILRYINRAGEKHEPSARLLMAIKKTGIPAKVRRQLYLSEGRRQRKHPTEEMLKSRQFYRENRQRAENVLTLFADDKSKTVWGGSSAIGWNGHLSRRSFVIRTTAIS